jgi:hypothetical protein
LFFLVSTEQLICFLVQVMLSCSANLQPFQIFLVRVCMIYKTRQATGTELFSLYVLARKKKLKLSLFFPSRSRSHLLVPRPCLFERLRIWHPKKTIYQEQLFEDIRGTAKIPLILERQGRASWREPRRGKWISHTTWALCVEPQVVFAPRASARRRRARGSSTVRATFFSVW